jgi:hypothetical protein
LQTEHLMAERIIVSGLGSVTRRTGARQRTH